MKASSDDLRDKGLKATQPRMQVIDALRAKYGRHLTAEAIRKHLCDAGTEIGIASIYRVMSQLERAGIVQRHVFPGQAAVFELTDHDEHDHMICLDTGRFIEFQDARLVDIAREVADRLGYEIEARSLVLYVRKHKRQR